MIARKLPLFQAINTLPIIVDPARLDDRDSTEEFLRRRQAKYHQSCRISLTNMKPEGHRGVSSAAPSEGCSNMQNGRSNIQNETGNGY